MRLVTPPLDLLINLLPAMGESETKGKCDAEEVKAEHDLSCVASYHNYASSVIVGPKISCFSKGLSLQSHAYRMCARSAFVNQFFFGAIQLVLFTV